MVGHKATKRQILAVELSILYRLGGIRNGVRKIGSERKGSVRQDKAHGSYYVAKRDGKSNEDISQTSVSFWLHKGVFFRTTSTMGLRVSHMVVLFL